MSCFVSKLALEQQHSTYYLIQINLAFQVDPLYKDVAHCAPLKNSCWLRVCLHSIRFFINIDFRGKSPYVSHVLSMSTVCMQKGYVMS